MAKMESLIKLFCLYLAITYGYSNTVKVIRGAGISNFQISMMGIGITGFIFLQFML